MADCRGILSRLLLRITFVVLPLTFHAQCTNYNIFIALDGACPQSSQITWQLIGSDGTLWLSGGAPFSQQVCLPDDCYTLNMLDTAGDGWECVDWFIEDLIGDFSFDTNLNNGNFGTDSFELGIGDCAGGGGGGNCPVGTTRYALSITDGDFPAEISWILSLGGITVLSSGANFNDHVCLADGCYVFEMFDTSGDGWNDAIYELQDDINNVLYTGTLFSGDYDFVVFNLGGLDCTGVLPGGGGPGGGGGGGNPGAGCGSLAPSSDCSTAPCVCDPYNFHISPSGFGTFNEIPSPGSISNPNVTGSPPWGGTAQFGCLLAGELNSNWMVFTAATTGTLQFSFGQNSNGGQFGFYDWAMWPYSGITTCSSIAGNSLPPVRCVWNATTIGGTGLASPIPAGGNSGNYAPPLNVIAGQQFIICMSNWSYANANVTLDFFGTASILCTLLLPVEIVSLNAEQYQEDVLVSWVTKSETNCDYFKVQKSNDGFNWESFAQQPGHGNTLNTQYYSVIDNSPYSGYSFYRLLQYDYNGMMKPTDPVDVFMKISGVSIFPNPANSKVNIKGIQNSKLLVFSIDGRVVESITYGEVYSDEIAIENWPEGAYIFRMFGVNNNHEEIIIVNHH